MNTSNEEFHKILNDLQSDDDVTVILAIEKLEAAEDINDTTLKQAILKELELLAGEHDNKDIRTNARAAYTRLRQTSPIREIGKRTDAQTTLAQLLQDLQNEEESRNLSALETLKTLTYSSEAIRLQLEKISLRSGSHKVRSEARALLNSPANRAVQQRFSQKRLDRKTRDFILGEIKAWAQNELIEKETADVLSRRYDFDITPPPAQPKLVPAQPATATLQATPAPITPAPSIPQPPPAPPTPRPSLLQTLTSEASIKIYLYLGAFFVIAAAAILGAVVPEFRLPILLLGTFLFGGLAVAIKTRLPQPSFALFIVFSFLLPITANSLEETMRQSFNLSSSFTSGYWTVVFFIMAVIWSGSTRLYESRLFSITAFGSLLLAFFSIGRLFNAEPEIYILLEGIAAFAGLAGVWLLRKWMDRNFSLPLFISTQILQFSLLFVSLSLFGANLFDPTYINLWHLAAFATWGLATVFFILSNGLYPFFAFPWLAAATLIPMPWILAASFDLESLGSAIVLMAWGSLFTLLSEVMRRMARTQKYSLPVLIASLPSLALALLTGFTHEVWLGMALGLACAILLAALHILHTRWWLWTLALLNAIIAYFAFFQLESIQRFDLFIGYQVAVIGILFLLPDLLLKKDWAANLDWRLPLRIFGAIFIGYLSLALLVQGESGHAAVCYFILAAFMTVYALTYRNTYLAYLPAAYLPLGIVFALDALTLDLWLPALSALAILYYLAGVLLRSKESWGGMLRISALALGASLSLVALLLTKETGGWYALVMGLLFITEMHVRKNGWFEIGAPLLFTLGISLILRDFDVQRVTTQLLSYSLVWILSDLLAHLTFTNPRPLSAPVRVIGAAFTLFNYGYLLTETDASIPALAFGIYALLFLTVSLLYRQPTLLYTFTLTLPLFVIFLFRTFGITQWIHPVIVIAMLYYGFGTALRAMQRAQGWDISLLYSGLGLGVIVSIAAPILGGVDASIPTAVAATLWAFEAYARKNAWLAFPANGLYLLAYFIILFELNVDEPQFFSVGTALFGLIQHYLLTRTESKSGAFMMGMFSQFVLLGTTYIEMVNKNDLNYFFLLFLQSLVVLVYGIVIRSRSLTFFPIGFVALGVVTVMYSALKDIGTIFVIGCTGILLLMLGVVAVMLREHIAKLGEKLSEWKA